MWVYTSLVFFVCTYTDTHTPFARIRAHLHNHLLAHTYAYTRHFTGDHTSCKYACIFKFTRVICVLICKLDHSTTSLPKNRLYSLFSFRFKSFPVKRFYRARSSDRTRDNRARFSLVVVNLWIFAIRRHIASSFDEFSPLCLFSSQRICNVTRNWGFKKKKKYCKRVVVPPFDFLEVYYEILIAGNKGKRLEKKKKRKKERKEKYRNNYRESCEARCNQTRSIICEHLLYTINHDRWEW